MTGASIPPGNDAFPPISIFIRQNFSRPFLVLHHKFPIFLLFPCFDVSNRFPPISGNCSLFFSKYPSSDFVKFTCLLHALHVFRFPLLLPWCIYASHNARTGCPWIVTVKVSFPRATLMWQSFNLCEDLICSIDSVSAWIKYTHSLHKDWVSKC